MSEYSLEHTQERSQTILTADALLLTRYYSLDAADGLQHEVTVTDQAGERMLASKAAGAGFDLLSHLLNELPPNNEYPLDDVVSACEIADPNGYPKLQLNDLQRAMPPEVFAINGEATPATARIGNIMLAGRKTTPEDVTTEARRYYAQRRAEVDAGKSTLFAQDHVKITLHQPDGDSGYLLVLNNKWAVLNTRCLMALKEMQYTNQFDEYGPISGHKLIDIAWEHMPTAERELFTKSKAAILGSPVALRNIYKDIFPAMIPAGRVGIVRVEGRNDYVLKTDFDLELNADPPHGRSALKGLIPMFPPGTDRAVVQRARMGGVLPETAIEGADFVLARLGRERLEQQEALNILDYLIDREVFMAIADRLQQSNSGITASQVRDVLYERVDRALRGSSARSNRTIAGNSGTNKKHRARQVSGELPITTKSTDLTKTWSFGDRIK